MINDKQIAIIVYCLGTNDKERHQHLFGMVILRYVHFQPNSQEWDCIGTPVIYFIGQLSVRVMWVSHVKAGALHKKCWGKVSAIFKLAHVMGIPPPWQPYLPLSPTAHTCFTFVLQPVRLAEAVAQGAKGLLWKHEGLSSDPQHARGSQMRWCTSAIPGLPWPSLGKWRILRLPWASQSSVHCGKQGRPWLLPHTCHGIPRAYPQTQTHTQGIKPNTETTAQRIAHILWSLHFLPSGWSHSCCLVLSKALSQSLWQWVVSKQFTYLISTKLLLLVLLHKGKEFKSPVINLLHHFQKNFQRKK